MRRLPTTGDSRSPFRPACWAIALWLIAWFNGPVAAFEHHTAHGGPVKGLAISPDGRWLVSTSFDYTAVLWSLDGFTERATLVGHDAAVNSAAFSPDGQFLATAGDDERSASGASPSCSTRRRGTGAARPRARWSI